LSWILIISTRSVIWLYVARFVSGLTLGGVSFVIPIYVAEIVEPSVRGPLSAIFQVRRMF
jgi:SP family facilitated glucose transporter-like MFS transporter 8